MIYAEPNLDETDEAVLRLIRSQRERLKGLTNSYPRRWLGSLRRNTFARAIQGSNTIEGYHATLDEAVAAIEDEPPLDERTETWFAVTGYRDAMTYILQASEDPTFEFSKQFLKSLHFMMTNFDLTAFPGRWRPGAVFVVNKPTGKTVYDPPDVEVVDELICELVEYLKRDAQHSTLVKSAMAHLNLTLIHPFKDGNGRMARALQTLMLATEGFTNPVFSSIEEWLGRNTEEYYAILTEVAQGRWTPERDAMPWIRFCLKAHYQQAGTVIRRFDEYDQLFKKIEEIVETHGLPDRIALPLFDSALGLRLTNSRYQREAQVTQYIAGRDLKRVAEIGLIEPVGEKRGRYYKPGQELLETRKAIKRDKFVADPYDVVTKTAQKEPRLPGM